MIEASSTMVRSAMALAAEVLERRGGQVFLVGGYVRDRLLGRPLRDVDLALAGDDPLAAARALADALGGHAYALDAERRINRVLARAAKGGGLIALDIVPLRGSLEEDLGRRDFTIDAMALPLAAMDDLDRVIDPWGGWTDLSRGLVRTVSEEALLEDPARLLRGVRLAGELGFQVEEGTAELMKTHAVEIDRVAGERIRDELCRILALTRSAPWLRKLDELGLLTSMLPELIPTRGVEQPREHYWDVFDHLLETVGYLERILDNEARTEDPVLRRIPWHPTVDRYFDEEISGGRTKRTLAKLAALFHDVGKPQTKTIEPSGRARFFGHADLGAEMATHAMGRLRFSRRETSLVAKAVEEHLRPMQLSQEMAPPTRRALYRYYRDVGEAALLTVYLSLADYLGARGPQLEAGDWRRRTEFIAQVVEGRFEGEGDVASGGASLLTGHDLMRELALEQGPLIGRLLEIVREAQAAGEAGTREEALALARRALVEMK